MSLAELGRLSEQSFDLPQMIQPDGWSRQSQYDDHAIQAFALAPEGA